MSLRSLFSLLFAAVLLAACGNNHDIRTRIDGDWHRQTLENDHLGHWLTALPTANGFFNTAVTRDWQVLDPQPGDLVGQTRGIYVMAVGHKLTGKPAYLEQVRLGTDFLLRHFRDPLHGGWYEAVGPDGKPTNDNKRLYSQAFAIFALAHAYRATQDKRYLDAALQTWSEIRLRYADAHGGYEKGVQGVITAISPEGEIKRQRGWWQQAEALRALMHHAAIRSRSDLWGHVTQQTEYIRTEFLDGSNGGWLDGSTSECRKGRCQDRQPDGYHMTAMHQEAIRIAALAR